LAHTNLGNLRPGEGVNLEADILAKYVYRMVSGTRAAPSGVTEEFLREQGFC
jgi:riboflavin synthase alpha subunit